MWGSRSADSLHAVAGSSAAEAESRLRDFEHREIDLLFRLTVLHERRELYPGEVTERQVDELDRRLDEIRAQIVSLRADLPTSRDE